MGFCKCFGGEGASGLGGVGCVSEDGDEVVESGVRHRLRGGVGAVAVEDTYSDGIGVRTAK